MQSQEIAVPVARRHDLDALRAIAMLLGIALHASMSLTGLPWVVQDTRTSSLLLLMYVSIHGFRMQLFMLVSGFFTMMVYRKRGLRSLVRQRFVRIFIPIMVGLVTVIPALDYASLWAIERNAIKPSVVEKDVEITTIPDAIAADDMEALRRLVKEGADVSQPDGKFKLRPLNWAALRGNLDAAKFLVENGADVNLGTNDGYSPLHHAAFLGHPDVLQFLIDKGAKVSTLSQKGESALDNARVPEVFTTGIAQILGIPAPEEKFLRDGRMACIEILEQKGLGAETPELQSGSFLDLLRGQYRNFLTSARFQTAIQWHGSSLHLFMTPIFDHLWFLWFLCFYVVFFAVLVCLMKVPPIAGLLNRLATTKWRFLWLSVLTLMPQLFNGTMAPAFGPDTAMGVIPYPHLLIYYFIFFLFGAVYYDNQDESKPLGYRWKPMLLTGVLVLLPLGLVTYQNPLLGSLIQVLYTWCMVLGLIGLFEAKMGHEMPYFRYLSDASYWLYLTHLPLVILLQGWIKFWPLPSLTKFLIITNVTVMFLLLVYQWLVRYTLIGRVLNGPRKRVVKASVGG